MLSPLLLATGLLTLTDIPAAPPTPTSTRSAYEAARDRAGRDAPAQVKLALWCEAHGLHAERLRHLAMAALRDPNDAAARGLMGIVRQGDQWLRPDKLAGQLAADLAYQARMDEYHARRDQAGTSADAQAQLAQWCESHDLPDEAKAHHAMVLRLDPNRETSRRKLGYKRDGHRWVTDDQKAAEREEAKQQNEANRRWRASLAEWRGWLDDRGDRPARARAELAKVTDPRAVPSILLVFARGGATDQARAIQLLGQIDSPGSSRALALLAVQAGDGGTRRAATEILKRRDAREFAGVLVAMLRRPLKFSVTRSDTPDSPGSILIEGPKSNLVRDYSLPSLFQMQPGDQWVRDRNGLPALDRFLGYTPYWTDRITADRWLTSFGAVDPGVAALLANSPLKNQIKPGLLSSWNLAYIDALSNDATGTVGQMSPTQFMTPGVPPDLTETAREMTEAAKREGKTTSQIGYRGSMMARSDAIIPVGQAIVQARQQFEGDIRTLEESQREIDQANAPVLSVLTAVSGKDYGGEPFTWHSWYIDQLGYTIRNVSNAYSVPTEVVQVTQAPPVDLAQSSFMTGQFQRMSCFGAGTLVQTVTGPQAIETLRVGDRVLTASTADSSLGYHAITAVHHNPPSPTFLVKLGGDTIVSSPFHRFWVVGRGWVMARDLAGGETLRVLGSVQKVDAVETGPVQPVFNLDVAGSHDFFAGSSAALVHDNSLPDTRLVPFDSLPAAVEVQSASR